jgi:hypothetical protein
VARDLGLSYKFASVILHQLHEAMAEEMKRRVVGGVSPPMSIHIAVIGASLGTKTTSARLLS